MATAPPPLKQLLRPGILLDNARYRLLRPIGEGGGGVVWLALHINMNSQVAIKFPNRKGSEAGSIEDEVKLHVPFSNKHPNIVSILDVGNYLKQPYVVMQYLSNGSLADRIISGKRTELLHASTNWLTAIADALDFIHDHGLLHCDVKPANIFLDDSMSAYLGDFGIAATSSSKASSGNKMLVGSLPYLAPELLLGEDNNAKTDQYALAISVYEFVTGTRPFAITSTDELRAVHQTYQLPTLKKFHSAFPVELESNMNRALAKEADQRFDNCRSFARAITSYWPLLEVLSAPGKSTHDTQRVKPPLPGGSTLSTRHERGSDFEQKTRSEKTEPTTTPLSDPATESRAAIKLSRLFKPKG